ncbi:MAG: hypothetical protein AAGI22_23345 [Planctomycetota bacterium]
MSDSRGPEAPVRMRRLRQAATPGMRALIALVAAFGVLHETVGFVDPMTQRVQIDLLSFEGWFVVAAGLALLFLLYMAGRELLALVHPPIVLHASARHLRPGDRLRLRWRFQRPPEWLEQLSLGLEARRYDCVNSRQLHQQKQRGHRGSFEVAQRIEVCDLDHPDAIREGEADVELPPSMKTSRVADNPGSGQGIVWFVTADGRGRTGFSESFEIRIEHEGARSRRIRRKRKKKERRGRARRPVR